jgi:two-component system, NtrC family, sensor histidine kinase KinB
MAGTVKKKIWYGTFFLFLLLIITGGVGIYYVASMKNEEQNILKANYESLSYCHTMQQQLDKVDETNDKAVSNFEDALKKQEANVTEQGEGDATKVLREDFNKLRLGDTSNMQAIQRKSTSAKKTAEDALTIIIAIAVCVFIIALTFLVNFPSVITNPINSFTEAIIQIANKNYSYRIHINNKDEFGKLADAFNKMAERLQYFESSNLNKLLFEKSRAEAVINSLKDASIGLDKSNIILFANEQALQLLNLHNEDMVGNKADKVAQKNDLFKFLLESNSGTPFKIVIQNHENYFIKETIEIDQPDTQSKVIVVKNITSFKELDEAKTNFIATVSHELKTPLAASDFSLRLLEDIRTGELSLEQKELITNLKQDNQRMLKILSELLNMSQLEAGKIQLNFIQTNPENIVDKAMDAVETNAREKNIIIKNYTADNLPNINADEDKTIWVLNNFLTNAIKYSPENGEVEISVHQQENVIIFSVKDHGKGIAREYQSKLFDRYFKVPGSNEKGTGLGLAISKDFIEAQGGKIWVESEPGQGSVFSFTLLLQ